MSIVIINWIDKWTKNNILRDLKKKKTFVVFTHSSIWVQMKKNAGTMTALIWGVATSRLLKIEPYVIHSHNHVGRTTTVTRLHRSARRDRFVRFARAHVAKALVSATSPTPPCPRREIGWSDSEFRVFPFIALLPSYHRLYETCWSRSSGINHAPG